MEDIQNLCSLLLGFSSKTQIHNKKLNKLKKANI